MARKKENHYKDITIGVLLFGAIIAIWYFSSKYIDNNVLSNNADVSDAEARGLFGDKFGAINALFSGLAFAGIIFTIFLQKRELTLQRDELEETRKEFIQQNFQTTFFSLLKNQNEISNTITAKLWYLDTLTTQSEKQLTGREFFYHCKGEMKKIHLTLTHETHGIYDIEEYELLDAQEEFHDEIDFESVFYNARREYINKIYGISKETWTTSKLMNEKKLAELTYIVFFNRYHFILGNYFRHLYHILKFLNDSESVAISKANSTNEIESAKNEYNKFAQFVQAQMSSAELSLLFYNCLAFPKLFSLVKKYNILENLATEDLIYPGHSAIQDIQIKSRTNLLLKSLES